MWNYLIFSATITLLSILFRHNVRSPISIVDQAESKYDYIIVGAGTAGCVMASRLSEDLNSTVLLIEAGGYFNWFSSIPLAAPALQKSRSDWAYKSESQVHSSQGLWEYKQFIPRGKGLGGSGQMNYMVHSFGTSDDYFDWPKGWSYLDLQPYFKKITKLLNVQVIPANEQLVKAMEIAQENLNETEAIFTRASGTIYQGTRWSTYQSHLQKAWNRKNLNILINTMATRIILDENNKAEAVEIRYEDGLEETVTANKEIIICAGAINTPQLLMISGIGPAEELEKHRIPVKIDLLGVGDNLADHMNMPIYVNLEYPISITLKKLQTFPTIVNYFVFGTGLLATNGITSIVREGDSGATLFCVGSADEKLLRDTVNYRSETFRSLFPSYNDKSHEGIIFLASCLQPKSRGYVTLRSSNIDTPPIIEPAYFESEDDIACTQNAIQLVQRVINTPLFREFGAEIHVPELKECNHLFQDYNDDAFSECAIRVSALTGHHASGTCKMGNDEASVVDEYLRVQGTIGLRIVDASVFPNPISGHPNSVIAAVAEKAADFILQNDLNA